MSRAYFVDSPRRIEELRVPHLAERELAYVVTRKVGLSAISYENFITDMLADRAFLNNMDGLAEGDPMKCVFVHQWGHRDGILVVPQYGGYVKWAAFVSRID